MAIECVYIARATDGLIFVASFFNSSMENSTSSSDKMEIFKIQAKQLLKRLSNRSPAKLSIESNNFVFHYVIEHGLCYLALTDKGYNKRLVFMFLDVISNDFVSSLNQEHGENWIRVVETVGRQYAFIKFDQVIQKRRREYSDQNSTVNIMRLHDDLQGIHNVLRKTIDDVLENNLGDVSGGIPTNVINGSRRMTENLSVLALLKKYMPFVILGALSTVILIYRLIYKK